MREWCAQRNAAFLFRSFIKIFLVLFFFLIVHMRDDKGSELVFMGMCRRGLRDGVLVIGKLVSGFVLPKGRTGIATAQLAHMVIMTPTLLFSPAASDPRVAHMCHYLVFILSGLSFYRTHTCSVMYTDRTLF